MPTEDNQRRRLRTNANVATYVSAFTCLAYLGMGAFALLVPVERFGGITLWQKNGAGIALVLLGIFRGYRAYRAFIR